MFSKLKVKVGRRPGPIRFLAVAATAVIMIFVTKALFPGGLRGGRDDFLGTIRVQAPRNAPNRGFLVGEPYRVIVEPASQVYFYVFSMTPDARIRALFPTTLSELENPVEKPFALPSEASAFLTEGPPGTHWVFSVGSAVPIDDFHETFDEGFLVDLRREPRADLPELIRERIVDEYTRSAFITVQIVPVEVLPRDAPFQPSNR